MKKERANDIKYTQAMLRHLPKFFMQLYFRERSADHEDQSDDLLRKSVKRESSFLSSSAAAEEDEEEMDEERQ